VSSQTPSRRPDELLGPHDQAEVLTAETDLASRWLGGSVVAASDESFGEKENLLNPDPAVFEPGRYGHRGEIVDGWETRRRREAGHDWALIRLGTPGTVTSVDVDTSFFTGNYPESCSIEACGREGYPTPGELNDPAAGWVQIVPRSPLRGDTHNTFTVSDPRRFTHLRLSTFPDGGVARLRVLGRVVPDPRPLDGLTIDLASQQHGGAVVASSDGFYTSARVLNRPDHARTMGEGWETRRRRDAGHDFVVFQLAFRGEVQRLVVDTAHFRYNASAEIAAYGCGQEPAPSVESPDWQPLLARTRLQPDTPHVFAVTDDQPVAAVRVDAFPDGGLSRVRVIGRIDPAARRRAGHRWFNALPTDQAIGCLMDTGVPPDVASEVADQRPLLEGWLDGLRGRSSSGHPSGRVAGYLGALSTMLEGRP
jgi:allantoicase